VYNSLENSIGIFGGFFHESTYLNDLWTYDFDTQTWEKLNSSGFSPDARKSHSAVYNPVTNRLIIFGGSSGPSSYLDDTWFFDFTAGTWLEVYTPVKPSSREGASFALNRDKTKGILFGGYDGSYKNDTWVFDLATEQWQLMTPISSPPARAHHVSSGLIDSNCIIIFGGEDSSGTIGDTWKYDIAGNSWSPLSPSTSPPDISFGSLVTDDPNKRCLLFGGINGTNQTWAFSEYSENWQLLSTGSSPPERWGHDAVYDSNGNRMVVFAGKRKIAGNPDMNDLWELNILPGIVPLDNNYVLITIIVFLFTLQLARISHRKSS
jgi:N-acetylneuraminic acid mutarotase